MFTGIDMLINTIITLLVTAFSCLFMIGSATRNRENEAYEEGYKKGYEDGMKVGGAHDI